jgi:hypothetical protein
MLDRGQRPSRSDRPQSPVDTPGSELGRRARGSSGALGLLDSALRGLRGSLAQPRLAAGLLLIAGGVVWAVARGLQFYGLAPASLAYGVDQPPLLLVLVGAWLWFRSRRR